MNILFAAGGTAGHINPALAVASYIRNKYPSTKILFVGTPDHMERELVPRAGFEFKAVKISGFRRSFSPGSVAHNVKTVAEIFSSEKESKKIINSFKPDVCVGFGGYVSGPVLKKASAMGIPVCIHEQNAYPGITNKALAKIADAVMLTVKEAEKNLEPKVKPVITGLPVRGSILNADRQESRNRLGIKGDKPLVLSFGGSLGAEPINEAMLPVLESAAAKSDAFYIHSVGKNGTAYYDKLESLGFKDGKKGPVEVRKYIDDMDVCMPAADLIISRAGASSLSEIEALGKASILIPSPYVAENHQYHNAMALVNCGAAEIIEEKDLNSQLLQSKITSFLSNPKRMKQMGENAKKLYHSDACEKIAEIILEIGEKND